MSEETAAAEATEETAGAEETVAAETAPAAETEIEKAEAPAAEAAPEAAAAPAEPVEEEEISYHAVEKEGQVTAIWEMQGRKHLRTIDPRSEEGKHILSLFTAHE